MFGKDKNGAVNTYSDSTTLIAAGTEIHGDIKFAGNLEIEGKVVGDVVAEDNSVATVRVLEHGQVEGDIRVPTVIINGSIKGNVFSSDHIELAAKAKVSGNVHYSLIEMTKGAQVNGNLVYGGERLAQVTTIAGSRKEGKAEAADSGKQAEGA
jgi:cytoskeletal protein CcmA (bactofilin family)